MKKIPIGHSDFKTIRSTPELLYVDKTDLISEFLEDHCMVLLITRPRRFGKTLNLSTLRYFFDQENAQENRKLFEGLKVFKNKKAVAEQGTRPVIYLTFKDLKERNWLDLEQKLRYLFSELVIPWTRSNDLLLDAPDQEFLQNIRWGRVPTSGLADTLKFLSRILASHFKVTPLILIDEYDVPLQSAWGEGYWDEAVTFFRNFFSAGFKDNPHLWRAVITGCLRVARESMFTGMNNLKVCGVSATDYSRHFGFTVSEVKQLIQDYHLSAIDTQIEAWYNGYLFGETTLYNPWSILNLMDQQGEFRNYWVNTSGNDLVKEILSRTGAQAKRDLEDLMAGQSITVPLQEHVVFQEIENSPANLWNFFYFTGYLKAVSIQKNEEGFWVELKIPNLEIKRIFSDSVKIWFQKSESNTILSNLKYSLMTGNTEDFVLIFQRLVLDSISYFDTSGNEPEKFYHGLVLGLMAYYSDTWHIRSNRESGYGRCDILMTPKNSDHYGIVMELKTHHPTLEKNLLATAQKAMEQIEKKQYEQELIASGAQKILKLGIGFKGKDLEILTKP